MATIRIAGGCVGGRRLTVPGGGVRPTQDRVREALFSSLGERVVDARFLDLFAGSGATGLEALSRGAAEVWWVEDRREVFEVLQRNVESVKDECAGVVQVRCEDVFRFLQRVQPAEPFTVVFADPPYARDGKGTLLQKTLSSLAAPSILSDEGLLVFEQDSRDAVVEAAGWHLLKKKRYGQTDLLFYTREPGSSAKETA